MKSFWGLKSIFTRWAGLEDIVWQDVTCWESLTNWDVCGLSTVSEQTHIHTGGVLPQWHQLQINLAAHTLTVLYECLSLKSRTKLWPSNHLPILLTCKVWKASILVLTPSYQKVWCPRRMHFVLSLWLGKDITHLIDNFSLTKKVASEYGII